MSVLKASVTGLRFVAGIAFAGLMVLDAWIVVVRFQPMSDGPSFDLQPPMQTLCCGAAAGYALAFAFGQSQWRRLLWSVRADLVILAGLAAAYWGFATWREGAVLAGLAIAGLVLHHVAHRHALGWVIDNRGERQKVEQWNRGNFIYKPTTRNQRLVEEAKAKAKNDRRKTLAWTLLFGGGLSYLAYYLNQSGRWVLAVIPALVGGTLLLFGSLPNLIAELLYQLGYQDMKGAKVLDPEPKQPGIDDVARQKVHGDASVADQREALNLLNPRR